MLKQLGSLVSFFFILSAHAEAATAYPEDYKVIRESFPSMTNQQVNAEIEKYLTSKNKDMKWAVLQLILEDGRRTWKDFRFRERMTNDWAQKNNQKLSAEMLPWGFREAARPIASSVIPFGSLIFTKMVWAYPFAADESKWIVLAGSLMSIPIGYWIGNYQGVPQSWGEISRGSQRTMFASTVITYGAVGCAALLRAVGVIP